MRILALILILLILFPITGCMEQTPQDIPNLTPEQVISVVQVYGVPYIRTYSGGRIPFVASSVGQWAAVYEGNGQWRVQGTIVITSFGRDYYLSNTWIYSDNKLRLYYTEKLPREALRRKIP